MRRMRHIKAREFQGCDVAYDFSNPSTLYDATSGGSLVAADGAIARAEDVSGNGNHMTQTSAGSRPLRKVASQNGNDAALFDGVNDYMTAGDVGDMLASPVTAVCVVIRTGGSGTVGYFCKARAGSNAGRWALLRSNALSADDFFIQSNATSGAGAPDAVTSLQVLSGVANRTTGASAAQTVIRRNGTQVGASANYTDTGASHNSADVLFAGCYNDFTGFSPLAGSYLTGSICHVAKYSIAFNAAQCRRREHSLMRRYRIAS